METTATRDAVMAANVHTNHALDPSVAEVTFPAAPGSLGRYERAASLVETAEPTVAGVIAILADHEAQPQSIYVHPGTRRRRRGIDRSCSPWSPNPLVAR